MLKKILNFILDCLFPWECLNCQQENEPICTDCLSKITLEKAGEKFDHPLVYLDGIFWATLYKDKIIQQAIHLLKYNYLQKLSEPLAKLLNKFFLANNLTQQFSKETIVMPIPLHNQRYLERGFNQAQLLAKKFASDNGYAYLADCLIRKINTPHQVGLKQTERQKNIQGAFIIKNTEQIKGKTIILIDDVVTTGATLEEAAKTLKNNGAIKVFGLVIAKD